VKIKVDFKSKGCDELLNWVACCLSPFAVLMVRCESHRFPEYP